MIVFDTRQSNSINPGERVLGTGWAIVIDIGKTLSKVTLWSRDGQLLARDVRTNGTCTQGGIRRLDVAGIGDWIVERLASHAAHPVEAIIPVGHGAGVVALGSDGPLIAPIDYEQAIPDTVMDAYHGGRDAFAITGSPALPLGLNFGSQLFWMDTLDRAAMEQAVLLPWVQYWAWFLSGTAVSEVTSLGCHSDVWAPAARDFSPMAHRLGWAERFAPLAHAGDAIGTLRPDLAARTGLSPRVTVHAGLHDSNAALLAARGFAAIGGQEATVLSTGTWFIAMRSPRSPIDIANLPDDRDCLVNVDVDGRAVPSARWMGGREIELLGDRIDRPGLDGVADVLTSGAMVLPTHAPGCGPFPRSTARWINRPDLADERAAAGALYAALVTDASLDLIGARDRLLVEGRFAGSELFVRALARLRPNTQVLTGGADADVSFGALRLLAPDLAPAGDLHAAVPLPDDLDAYRSEWRDDLEVFQ